jgi:hypothetical protein
VKKRITSDSAAISAKQFAVGLITSVLKSPSEPGSHNYVMQLYERDNKRKDTFIRSVGALMIFSRVDILGRVLHNRVSTDCSEIVFQQATDLPVPSEELA